MKKKNAFTLLFGWTALLLGPSAPGQTAADHPASTSAASTSSSVSHSVADDGGLTGRVLNASNGEYLERARVTIEGTSLETFTDSSGSYRFPRIPAGPQNVRVFFTGTTASVQTVTITPGETARHDVALRSSSPTREGDVVELSKYVVGASREMDGAAIAINEQRFAPNISHVVSAGEFGISADGSVGEFLKYIPGISIDYVGGTANTISMDGVPSNYVPVTVGGFDLASTSSASTSRSTELLQISIHNAARIEVTHSPTPESPASALAGSVNIVPRSAFERVRPLFTGSVYLMMRDNARDLDRTPGPGRDRSYKVQPGFDFSYVAPVNKRLGYTVSGSYSKQFIPQDTVTLTWRGAGAATTGLTAATAATQYPDTTADKPYLSEFFVSDNIKFNKRGSFGTTVDYKLSDQGTLSFSYQYGTFSSENNNNTITFSTNRIDPGNFSLTSVQGVAGRGQVTITNGHRYRTGETHMPTLVYRHNGSTWRTEAGVGHSHSTNSLKDFDRGFMGNLTARLANVTVAFDDIFYLRPRTVSVTTAAGSPVDAYKLNNYALVSTGAPQPRESIDVRQSAYVNARREFDLAGVPLAIKAGLDVRRAFRDMRGSNETFNYVGPAGTPALLYDEELSQRTLPYGFPQLESMSAFEGWDFYRANPTYFTSDPNGAYRNAVGFSKYAEQLVSSGYVRGDLALVGGKLKLVGGVRVEQTNIDAEGPLTDPTRNYQRDAAGNVILGADGRPLRIATDSLGISRLTYLDRGMIASKEYFRIFPSVNASYNLLENLIARAAYYTSIGRPDYNQYAGGITLPDVDDPAATNQRITVNNVAIKPWMAETKKIRLEYYFEGVGQVAIGAFRRDFENFFASTTFAATPAFLTLYNLDPDVYGTYDVVTQRNLSNKVRMTGIEAEYKQALTFLPHWARGVQAFANFTAIRVQGESEADFSGFIPRTYNWGVSLSRKKFSLRANWNYQGRRRLEQITGRGLEAGTFSWRQKRLNFDLQGEYYITPSLSVFANLRNIGAAAENFERYGPSTPELGQFRSREDYGASWTFGVKGTF